MLSTARLYFDATVALAIMATLGVVAGFVAFAVTSDRTLAMLATAAVFAVTGMLLTIRLWRITRNPTLSPPAEPATPRAS
jgi:hypothetical protein